MPACGPGRAPAGPFGAPAGRVAGPARCFRSLAALGPSLASPTIFSPLFFLPREEEEGAWLALARGLRAPAWGLRFAALPGGPPGDLRCCSGLFGSFDNPEIVNRLHEMCSKRPAAVLPLSGCRQGFPPAGAPALTLPGIFLPGGLDFSGPVWYFVRAWLASRSLGGHLSRCPRRERKPLCCEAGRLFFMLWLACPAAPVT